MQIVIELDEDIIENLNDGVGLTDYQYIDLVNAIMNSKPLPEGHGDLIDRKDLLEYTDISISAYTPTISRYSIITAPTIVEADKEG